MWIFLFILYHPFFGFGIDVQVLKLTPRAFNPQVEKLSVNIPAVSTHRPKRIVTPGKGTPILTPIEKQPPTPIEKPVDQTI